MQIIDPVEHWPLVNESTLRSARLRRMVKGTRQFLSGCIVGLISFSTAQAVPINYDEQVDGDLAAFGALPILAFDVGVNTVRGSFGFVDPGPTDYDSFAFSIPANMQLLGAAVTLTDALGNVVSSKWGFRAGSDTWAMGTLIEEVQSPSPGAALFTTLPLGPDTYNLSHISFGIAGPDNNTANYDFSFRVAEIPEPSTVVLAALGFLVCGGVARRRQFVTKSASGT